MKRLFLTFVLAVIVLVTSNAQNRLTVNAAEDGPQISKYIYGHFAEHLGRCIYDGIWVGPGSPIPNVDGYRKDVLEALKALEIPVLRWPGGCFADTYHWKDGIGPKEKRPKIKNVFWGGTVEDNSFGTHEFLNLCEMLGCDAYISANVGSGTVEEMVDWIEYMISDDDVEMANLRRQNGREKPWKVRFLGVGNESWGCGGQMTPEFYVDKMRQFSSYAWEYAGDRMVRVGCGANGEDYNWTKVLMERGARNMNALSVHYYTIAGEGWGNKSAATGFGEDRYFNGLRQGLRMEEVVSKHSVVMDEYDPRKRVGMFVDEWGIWTDVEPGTNPGFLFQQNSMRDALIASTTLDIFNRHADRVKMANIAQMVNVLQSMILTEGDQMVLTPTYHVFNMYKVHGGATLLPANLFTEKYVYGNNSLPAISQTVSRDESGKIHVSLSNIDPAREMKITVEFYGKQGVKVNGGTLLTAPAFNSFNAFNKPAVVKPVTFKNYKLTSPNVLEVTLPSKSVVTLEME
ncbi:MAG TPA: alpha-L-arabinofuranosidase C-terminal domain-containing protein [Prolixibacteraceae bacterium]|jgi:alpha-N-arabinofuranosidase|nr:alpha-N-arabinofuranosidase [Prolixibacteraceae bacterium]NLS98381.1 alpha-N-arabinofuranosidase [Bacteroidales bacterium]OQB82202.1 MAG: Intracellular exo-alpha-L-arabinofuranosidase 2 [Bacteroidetes bacterium ADurb.Bin123]HNU78024.1 alpha-L-arabinofuranosidase C-terminal domain-containing protein [Prolixibacteraceae bacterium]HNZ69841.1 alpha-L-arabinofuranosidase C-terminal domain-containing protein [Prolixibacteraceae bacterium]